MRRAIQFALVFSPPLARIYDVSEFTQVLKRAESGDSGAAAELLPVIYNELRKMAAAKMAREAPGHTLQPTALVHEAWLRLGGDGQPPWQNRAHYFAAAAEAMRRILIDSARRKQTRKHGGDLERVDIDSVALPIPIPDDELIALDEALDRLAILDSRAAEVVKLCFFVGLTQEQAAQELCVSVSTVERLWSFSRAWLFQETKKGANPGAQQS
jgi:RNA polymerase sigma factor (TIGR02999 family)